MEKKAGLFLYADTEEVFGSLPDEEAGKLIKAIFIYNNTGEVPELPGLLNSVFMSFKRAIDENKNRYKEISEKRKAAVQTRWAKEKEKEFEMVKDALRVYLSRELTAKEMKRLEEVREKYSNAAVYLAIMDAGKAGGRTLKYVEKILEDYEARGLDRHYENTALKDVYKGLFA